MNKLVVVTGGTKGIGRALVDKFAAEGFDVVTCARNAEDLRQLKKEVEQKSGKTVYVFQADLSVRDQVKQFCNEVQQLNRDIDVLINNAGYFTPGALVNEPEGVLESMIEANLYSAYQVTRGLIEGMIRKKNGHVFNMCSIASIKAYPNGGSYAISKFALLGFTKCLREEMKELGIRVTAVLPGATLTASWAGVNLPEERFIKSEDVAETIFAAWSISGRSVVEELIIRPQLGDI